jgi:hypothetical protein
MHSIFVVLFARQNLQKMNAALLLPICAQMKTFYGDIHPKKRKNPDELKKKRR